MLHMTIKTYRRDEPTKVYTYERCTDLFVHDHIVEFTQWTFRNGLDQGKLVQLNLRDGWRINA